MVSVEEAIRLVKTNLPDRVTEIVQLVNALNYLLAEDVVAKINMPPFNQSSMDGYAVNYSEKIETYALVGEIAAGDSGEEFNVKVGESVRIFTGAIVPKGANTVVQQEIVNSIGKEISFTQPIKVGSNIRPLGEQTKTGQVALKKGEQITPAAVGFLAGLGITEVVVYKKPTLAVLVTGNELVKSGEPLPKGKIYESNAIMLKSGIEHSGYDCAEIGRAEDTFQATKLAIEKLLRSTDVLLVSGGISVGDYDFVGKALIEIGVKQIFYKVKQKPGKPLFFGTYQNKLIFALPGNPAAALSCFYVYVYQALAILSGKNDGLPTRQFTLKNAYAKKGDRAQFLKAKIDENQVEILEGQSSAMLHTFALADALVYVSETDNELEEGETVTAYILP
ncbi:MAG: molybdopterin molybdotransferase MoeA [Flavobacteriales bacterium]|nr:molybdopterin molybdotransferase MoeA [Flavobacteriales bacterium]